jgi:hypothetical protein
MNSARGDCVSLEPELRERRGYFLLFFRTEHQSSRQARQ